LRWPTKPPEPKGNPISGDSERDVHTESFDDYPGESLVTGLLVENGGKTTMTATILYPSQEVRDAVIKSGMEHGAAECYDKLAEMLS
jgi:uncharacterized protein YndB with AHSA1/START domain